MKNKKETKKEKIEARTFLNAWLKNEGYVLNESNLRFENGNCSIDSLEIYSIEYVQKAKDLIEAIYRDRLD